MKKAIRSAIADCIARGVLPEYLADHEKEVVSIMMTLYDEEELLRNHIAAVTREAVAKAQEEGHAKGMAEGRMEGRMEGEIRGIVRMCQEFKLSKAETVSRVMSKLGLDAAQAESAVADCWD